MGQVTELEHTIVKWPINSLIEHFANAQSPAIDTELNRRRRQLKNVVIFYQQNSKLSRLVKYANSFKSLPKLNMQSGVLFQIDIRSLSRLRPRSSN